MTASDRLAAALADRYRIERELGQGGMATVYLAEDLKHKRNVALKVLKPELAAVLGAERFVQEITTTAALQHPHILPLFDSGTADGFLYYVMPFIDGETLRGKLDRETQLGVDEAVKITTEVADALHYAHTQGIIHRDIKPENILLANGRPMVADFGIALAVSAAAGGRMTETGLSLGTPHYMSPEQATAERDITARSDQYSLASVLYEMLSGNPPHTGATAQQIIMKIITEQPADVSSIRRSVPPHVAAAIAKALSKLAADRFATTADFATALANPSFILTGTALHAAPGLANRWRTRFVVTAAAAVVLAVVASGLLLSRGSAPTISTYDVGLPDSAMMNHRSPGGLSISADGKFVVYVARRGPSLELWYRSLVDSVTRPIPGTTGGNYPSVSPGGDRVAFVADAKLHVVPIGGGTRTTLANATTPNVRWLSDDRIMLMHGDGTILRWLDGTGQVGTTQSTVYCQMPEPLNNGERLLCGGGGDKSAYIIQPGTDSLLPVMSATPSESAVSSEERGSGLRGSHFRVIDDKYLVYMSIDGDLRATTIDLARRRVGKPVTLVRGIQSASYFGAGQYDISSTGTLVYASGTNAAVGQLVRYRPQVGLDTLNAPPAAYLRFTLSRNARWLAAATEGLNKQELHVIDLSTGRSQTFLSDVYVGHPLWDPSSTTVMVDLGDRVTVRGAPTMSAAPDTVYPESFTPLTYVSDDVVFGLIKFTGAVGLLNLKSKPPQLDTLLPEGGFPALSPDSKWLAYNSTDFSSLYLSPVSNTGKRYLVAAEHEDPQWLSPTQLLFSKYAESSPHVFKIMDINPNSDQVVGTVRDWYTDSLFTPTPGRTFTVTRDGGVVYLQGMARQDGAYLRIVPNWVTQMKRTVDEANR